jgi:hypothetical protein
MHEISLNVLDIVQNSIKANANLIEITIEKDTFKNQLYIGINDNGCGMDKQMLNKIIDPFFTTRTTRKVGLGVPFFKMSAELTGGDFKILSKLGVGTKIQAVYNYNHIDMMPIGNITQTITTLIQLNPDIDFIYKYIVNKKEFILNTIEIKNVLDGVPINSFDVIKFIENNIIDGQLETENFKEEK